MLRDGQFIEKVNFIKSAKNYFAVYLVISEQK